MTFFQRIKNVLIGLVFLAAAVLFLTVPLELAYPAVVAALALSMAVKGIRDVVYYFRLARHMVGGKMILIQGVIVLDFALFTATLTSLPQIIVLIYLVGLYAFSGVIKLLRAMEAKGTVDGPWKLNLVRGLINLAIAVFCLIFMKQPETAVIIFSAGLIYSALERFVDSIRKVDFAVPL